MPTEIKLGFTVDQLIEDGRVTKEDITAIKSWLTTYRNGIPAKLTDEQVATFLLSCSNRLDSTKDTIQAFYATRNSCPTIFDQRSLKNETLRQATETLSFGLMPQRRGDDHSVLFFAIQNQDYKQFNLGASLKLITMTIDAAIYDNPPKGIVIVFNMRGFGLMHLIKFRVNLLSPFFRYVQEGMHVQLKEVHVLNTASFIDKLMLILRPFIKPELMRKMHFHASDVDMDKFFEEYVPQKCLPIEYGGSDSEIRVLKAETVKKLAEMESYFNAEENQRRNNMNI